jgi:RNA polymerase sigma factor (TIGR02999 family)
MFMVLQNDVSQMLKDWRNGDQSALDRLMPVVYDELRRIASKYLRSERPDHTLQTTALVHEAYMRLVKEKDLQLQNRAHFFGIAAHVMRRILVKYAIAGKADKRGGGSYKLSLDEAIGLPGQPDQKDLDIIALNKALNTLGAADERKSKIIELRFFAGLSNEEIADAMGLSLATVNREWRTARAWLYKELQEENHKDTKGTKI